MFYEILITKYQSNDNLMYHIINFASVLKFQIGLDSPLFSKAAGVILQLYRYHQSIISQNSVYSFIKDHVHSPLTLDLKLQISGALCLIAGICSQTYRPGGGSTYNHLIDHMNIYRVHLINPIQDYLYLNLHSKMVSVCQSYLCGKQLKT